MARRWDVGPEGRIMNRTRDAVAKESPALESAAAASTSSNAAPSRTSGKNESPPETSGPIASIGMYPVDVAGSRSVGVKFSHIFTFRDTVMRVNGLCFSPDGSLLLQSSWDCSLQILDVHRCCSVRSLHSNKHGIESVQLVAHCSHLCVCPTKQQNAAVPKAVPSSSSSGKIASESTATHAVPGGTRVGQSQNAVLTKPSEPAAVGAPFQSGVAIPAGGSGGQHFEGSCSYTLRLWDLRENRYIRVFPVTGRVVAGTGVCPHPSKAAFVCCTDDGVVSYFVAEREAPLWKKQVHSRRPLVAMDPEGTTLAVYEGGGTVRFYDLNNHVDPFLTFGVAKYLQGHSDGSCLTASESVETPTSLLFSPEGGQLILGTDHERLFSFNSFTGELVTVWQPPAHTAYRKKYRRELSDWQQELESALDRQGAKNTLVDLSVPEEHSFPAYDASHRKNCAGHEGFIPSVECFSETLFYGSSDGNVYGYDMSEVTPVTCQKSFCTEEAGICHQCGGELFREKLYANEAGSSVRSEGSRQCWCRRSQSPVHTLGPHVCEPLWTAANPKYSLVATASINCSLWKGTSI